MAKRKKPTNKCNQHKLKMVEGGPGYAVYACTNKGCNYRKRETYRK